MRGVTYDGQTYGVPYSVESVALVRNNALTQDAPTTYDDMIASGKVLVVRSTPSSSRWATRVTPITSTPSRPRLVLPVFKQGKDGSYTNQLALGGQNGQNYANWLRTQGKAGIFNPLHHL